MVQLKNILLTAVIVGTLMVGFSAFALAGTETGTPQVIGMTALTKAMVACDLTSEQQAQFVKELNKISAQEKGATAQYGMWAPGFASMGTASPGHVSGMNGQDDQMEIWYVHNGNNGGTFVGMRTVPAIGNAVIQEDPFCGTWNYTDFTITGYADQSDIHGKWWVWWN